MNLSRRRTRLLGESFQVSRKRDSLEVETVSILGVERLKLTVVGLKGTKESIKLREENVDLKKRIMQLENQISMGGNNEAGGSDYEQKMQRVVRDYLEQIEQLRNENEELQSKKSCPEDKF
jgi:uncharacterized membrane protein YcgQ (UPF0703/DUF1980 family)